MTGLRPQNPVEAFKALPCRPAIKRPGGVLLPTWREMPLPKTAGRVAILLENLSQGRTLLGNRTVIRGKTIRNLRDAAHMDTMVIPSGQQSRPRRRA